MAADFWNKPGADNGVVAHTADESQYHYPDERQSARMGSGIGGVVIPRANQDGTSKGFDSGTAGMVHVDPDAPDGGAIVDLSSLSADKLYNAFSAAKYPHQVYYNLGESRQDMNRAQPDIQKPQEPARTNPYVPQDTYVVPKSGDDGIQYTHQQERRLVQPMPQLPSSPQGGQLSQATSADVQPAPYSGPAVQPTQHYQPKYQPQPEGQVQYQPQHQPMPVQQSYPQYQQYPPPPSWQPQVSPVPPGQYDHVMNALSQLTNVVSGLANQVQTMQRQPDPAPVPPLRSLPRQDKQTGIPTQGGGRVPPMASAARLQQPDPDDFEQPQTLAQLEASAEDEAVRNGVIVGFETLNMRFINGPHPTKPKKQVFFEMPGSGTMAARYHAVIEDKNCLVLVTDSRFEDGPQYLPPDLGAKVITVGIPQTGSKEAKEIECCSMGFHFNIGVLDIILLVKPAQTSAAPVYDEDDEE